MIKIVLKVTQEEFENLDATGLLSMDAAGVFYQSVSISSDDDETDKKED